MLAQTPAEKYLKQRLIILILIYHLTGCSSVAVWETFVFSQPEEGPSLRIP